MASDLDRFRHLERPRQESDDPQSPAPTPERSPPSNPSALTLDPGEPASAEPFIRCAGCEADNGRYSAQCYNCGSLLDTPEQKAFNEKFWRQRLAQAELETQERAQRSTAFTRLPPTDARARDEGIAEEVAQSEDQAVGVGNAPAPGTRLLRGIQAPRLRLAVSIALVLIICVAAYVAFNPHGKQAQRALAGAFLGIAALVFIPTQAWRSYDDFRYSFLGRFFRWW